MHSDSIKKLLEEVAKNQLSVDAAYQQLRDLPYADLDFAKIDNHRGIRKGFPEVIYCQGKTIDQVKDIIAEMRKHGSTVMATRADEAMFEALSKVEPNAFYHQQARIIVIDTRENLRTVGDVAIISAGTADIPVAEEAAVTAEVLQANVTRVYDVGVAGLHRLLSFQDTLTKAKVIVVVAGMDGVLPSVVGGLVGCPVIAVPTSIGYGAHFHGIAPLLTMLNSCATGVSVVNIDNGFGAGFLAAIINRIGENLEIEE